MSSISVKAETKAQFDELQPEDDTQDDFMQTLLETYQKDVDGVVIDPEEIAQQIKEHVATEVELASYRGTTEALENHET
jgi:hypothetical protein